MSQRKNNPPEVFDLTDEPSYHSEQEKSKDSIVLLKPRDLGNPATVEIP